MKRTLEWPALLCAGVMMLALVSTALSQEVGGDWVSGEATANAAVQSPTPTANPAICDVSYSLAPAERSVLLCLEKPWLRAGLVQLQSRHEDVDAALIQRVNRLTVFSVTNRSTAPVDGVARVEIW